MRDRQEILKGIASSSPADIVQLKILEVLLDVRDLQINIEYWVSHR